MERPFIDRIRSAWNAFTNRRDPPMSIEANGSFYRPDRHRLSRGNERSIVTSIINRIAIDVSSINIRHVRLDDAGRYKETIDSDLNNCLSVEANIDQTSRAFIQDAVMSMLNEGVVALVPIDTTDDPYNTTSYDIQSLRTGKIVEWFPNAVRIDVYNDRNGQHQTITMPKRTTAIVENPLYAVMNEPNSTLQRLIRKLNLLDIIDENNSSGKLDLIIQLPYVVKSEARKQQANERRKEIERQLVGSKYGIAYTDGTEKITQLNRAVENNLMSQIEFLTRMLYSQLGITETIMDGTANEETMINYNNRSIEPIISALVDEMHRKYLTKTARTQGQAIKFFNDPFKLVSINNIAEIADKFTRNEIMTSNEIRQIVGMKPSDDPAADELRNKNLNQSSEDLAAKQNQGLPTPETLEEGSNLDLESLIKNIDSMMSELDEIDKEFE